MLFTFDFLYRVSLMRDFFQKIWYHPDKKVPWYLYPVSWLYIALFSLRKFVFDMGIIYVPPIPVPVIVIGNITVGGTGKTPLVIELVNYLKEKGFRPGVVSRGYKGLAEDFPFFVSHTNRVIDTGDEPMLIYQRTQVPVVIDPQRSRAAKLLAYEAQCDVIISDDGLQHYKLDRHFEIVVVDSQRIFGNKKRLPAGPLREKIQRINDFDLLVINGNNTSEERLLSNLKRNMPLTYMHLNAGLIENVRRSNVKAMATFSASTGKIHAVAGIGNPERFFEMLKKMDFDIIPHAFPDHHYFTEQDLIFDDDLPVIMTEKDAVKCADFDLYNLWFLPVSVELDESFYQSINRFMSIK